MAHRAGRPAGNGRRRAAAAVCAAAVRGPAWRDLHDGAGVCPGVRGAGVCRGSGLPAVLLSAGLDRPGLRFWLGMLPWRLGTRWLSSPLIRLDPLVKKTHRFAPVG